jgi:hypothetical protein
MRGKGGINRIKQIALTYNSEVQAHLNDSAANRGESGVGCTASPLGCPAPLTRIGLPLGPHEQSGSSKQPTSTS